MAAIEKQLAEKLSMTTSEVKSKIKENQIFVGNKPFMRYVRSAEILLRNKNLRLISIRGRGMNINKAVDLAEAIKNKFCQDLNLIMNISTSTEKFLKDDREFSVSVIELNLKR
jgi:DNA-binding protein Alba